MLKRLWAWSGLDVESLLFVMKVAAPPAIAQSLYENEAAAEVYGNLGYLLSLSTLLACGTLPRAKFVHNMLISVFAVLFSSAINLLALLSGLKARTTAPNTLGTDYSASQQAVCGVWLWIQVYFASYCKSVYPQYNYAILSYEIIAIVAMMIGSKYIMVSEAIDYTRTILVTFLTGFAITTVTSLLVMPVSCRKIAFDDMTAYFGAIRNALKAQVNYMTSVEDADIFPRRNTVSSIRIQTQIHDDIEKEKSNVDGSSPEAIKLKNATTSLLAIQGKLSNDIVYAKREISWGVLSPDDINQISKLLSNVTQPLVGLNSIIDILDTVAKLHGWDDGDGPMSENDLELIRQQTVVVQEWQTVMKMLHEPFHNMIEVLFQASEHIMLHLSLKKSQEQWWRKERRQKPTGDTEAASQIREKHFASELERAIQEFFVGRKVMIAEWCVEQGVDLTHTPPSEMTSQGQPLHPDVYKQRENHIQLLVLLYMRQLLRTTSQNILELVLYVDQRVTAGTLRKKRLILPGLQRVKKIFHPSHNVSAEHNFLREQETRRMLLDDALYDRKDPEHLPPVNKLQRFGNLLRVVPRKLRSGHSIFGFRVACAVMSLAILGFHRSTQDFFIAQRGTWSLIMIVFSMNPTAGASIFQFFYRCAGTLLALVACMTSYYIPNGNSSGILIMLYLWMIFHFWIMVKKPKYVTMAIISAMAIAVMLGYIFEEKAFGEEIQPFYPPYIVALYRFLCVIIGVSIALIWTIFPYPISERSEVRRGTATLLHLLAKYYAISHATSLARIQGREDDITKKHSPGWLLEKARKKTLAKTQLLISRLKVNSAMVKWQLNVGGAFPQHIYATLITAADSFMRSTTLLADASLAFTETGDPAQADWLQHLRMLVVSVQETSQEVVSILSVLSSSIASGEPLPPFLPMPEPFRLTERLKAADPNIMATAHLAEPGYAAVAVIQLASGAVEADLEILVREVKNLVGELDFRFRPFPLSTGTSIRARLPSQMESAAQNTTMRHRGPASGSSEP